MRLPVSLHLNLSAGSPTNPTQHISYKYRFTTSDASQKLGMVPWF